ncbi:MAG: protein phosphatase 2C domain-containing protein [Desulfosarcinaceae bacterium]
MTKIIFLGLTDVGLVRSNNEDAFLINDSADYCLVADGMGGAAAGETASLIFSQTASEILTDLKASNEQEAVERVQKAFRLANDRILEHVARNPQHEGMGCTAELLVFGPMGYVIGHMGDSRTYRLRQGVFKV